MESLIESFFWGIIAAFGALVVEVVFFVAISPFVDPNSAIPFSQFFVLPQFIIASALVEETFKCIFIFRRFKTIPTKKYFLLNSFLLGLGFFAFELALILMTKISPAPQFLAEIAIVHVGTAGLIGYIAIAKNTQKITTFVYAVLATAIFHAAYNLSSVDRTSIKNYLIFYLLGLLIAINIANTFRAKRVSDKMPV